MPQPGLEPGPSDPESSTLTTGLLTPSYKKRREFYKGRFYLKETNITEIIGIAQGYANGRIFVNENLTQYRQEVLAKARKMKKANKIFRVWTVDGKIFVRKTEDSRPVRISEIWELDEPAT